MLTLTKHAYGLQSVHAVNDNAHSWLQTTAITAHVKSNELGSTRAEFHKPHGIPHPTFSTRITLSRKSTEFMLAGFHLSISKQRPQTYGWFEHNTITTTVGLYFGKLHRTQWNKTEIKTTTKTHKTRRGNGTAATSTFNSTVSQLCEPQYIIMQLHDAAIRLKDRLMPKLSQRFDQLMFSKYVAKTRVIWCLLLITEILSTSVSW